MPSPSLCRLGFHRRSNRQKECQVGCGRVLALVRWGLVLRATKAGYFRELLATNPDIDEGLRALLRQCRETVVRLGKSESALIRSLEHDRLLAERVQRLMSIPAIGQITALTWALEIGEVQHQRTLN